MASTAVARKYTNISFDEIRDHLMEIVRAKMGPIADLGDSAYGKMMIELFAGFGDLTANWVESAFENSWIETAFAKPPMYAGARSLGYSIRRPMPAKCSIGIRVAEIREHATLKVFIPKGTVFTMTGTTLTALSDMEFSYDYDTDTTQTGVMSLTSGLNVLAEGQMRSTTLLSNGRQNQVFYINDPSFSDYFGDNDPNFADDGNMAHRPACFTTVTSDATLVDNVDPDIVIDDKLYWRISRRGLEDPSLESTAGATSNYSKEQGNYTNNYTVLVSTANNGMVELRFGDGLKSAIPFGDIEVRYFSTHGESGNMMNVFGTALSTTGSGITLTTADGLETDVKLSDLNICLTTDIRGGLNMESVDSIKNNASAVYSSLDRLVTGDAYKIFLRRYSDVKYATAYGEDVLNTKLLNGGINVKYMNQVRFSALKDLYREKDGKYYPTTEDEYLLDGYKVNGLMYNWLYDFQEPNASTTVANAADVAERVLDRLEETIDSALDNLSGTAGVNPLDDEQKKAVKNAVSSVIAGKVATALVGNGGVTDTSVFSAFLTPLDFVVEGSELHSIMLALNRRGMLTVGDGFHNYVYPSVHNMNIKMDVVLFKGNNFTDIRDRIKNVVYKYLKDNTDIGTPVYRSKISSLVHTMKEVAGVDVTFEETDSAFRDIDLAEYTWMSDAASLFINQGTAAISGMTYNLGYIYDGHKVSSEAFTIGDQGPVQDAILSYYRGNIQGLKKVGDKTIDRFVAYIWNLLMDEIYRPVQQKLQDAMVSGSGEDVGKYNSLIRAIKTWDMEKSTIKFKDSGDLVGVAEVNGSSLFDYMRYGMDYIKLVRRVLGSKSTASLIDPETGNITEYSNSNEIVQFNIPNELINISVAQYTSLVSSTGK